MSSFIVDGEVQFEHFHNDSLRQIAEKGYAQVVELARFPGLTQMRDILPLARAIAKTLGCLPLDLPWNAKDILLYEMKSLKYKDRENYQPSQVLDNFSYIMTLCIYFQPYAKAIADITARDIYHIERFNRADLEEVALRVVDKVIWQNLDVTNPDFGPAFIYGKVTGNLKYLRSEYHRILHTAEIRSTALTTESGDELYSSCGDDIYLCPERHRVLEAIATINHLVDNDIPRWRLLVTLIENLDNRKKVAILTYLGFMWRQDSLKKSSEYWNIAPNTLRQDFMAAVADIYSSFDISKIPQSGKTMHEIANETRITTTFYTNTSRYILPDGSPRITIYQAFAEGRIPPSSLTSLETDIVAEISQHTADTIPSYAALTQQFGNGTVGTISRIARLIESDYPQRRFIARDGYERHGRVIPSSSPQHTLLLMSADEKIAPIRLAALTPRQSTILAATIKPDDDGKYTALPRILEGYKAGHRLMHRIISKLKGEGKEVERVCHLYDFANAILIYKDRLDATEKILCETIRTQIQQGKSIIGSKGNIAYLRLSEQTGIAPWTIRRMLKQLKTIYFPQGLQTNP